MLDIETEFTGEPDQEALDRLLESLVGWALEIAETELSHVETEAAA